MAAIRSAIVGAIAIGVLAFGVAGASAAESTTFKATSTNFQVTGIGAAANIKCGTVSFNGTLGAGKATTSNFVFANCVDVFYNLKVNVSAVTPWEPTFTSGTTVFNGINLKVTFAELPSCSYNIVGKATSARPSQTIAGWSFAAGSGTGPMSVKNPTNTCKGMSISETPAYGGWVVGNFSVTPPFTPTF
jgi:hypothetical protein